ncbi:MAG: hypothetical protein Q8O95_05045 [bacterium]|nr:hypothetical protein [bacterium]
MKTFQYKARNEQGMIIEGKLKTSSFHDATGEVRGQGLELISLEEVKEQLKAFIFDAQDKSGEMVQGTVQGTEEGSVREMLEKEFGYRVLGLRTKGDHQPIVSSPEQRPSAMKSDAPNDSIIFSSHQPHVIRRPSIAEEELVRVHEDLQSLLTEQGAGISESTRGTILHLDGLIDLVRESQDKKRWKNLKAKIRDAQKIAEREIKAYRDKKWKQAESQGEVVKINSFNDFEEAEASFPTQNPVSTVKPSKPLTWLQIINQPNLHNEWEVLTKQKYESVWSEAQRFGAALFAFYLVCFFFAYYLKRNGVEDHFLVRIYDTTLFKQIVVLLFSLFALMSLRLFFLPKNLKTDAVLVALFIVSVLWISG